MLLQLIKITCCWLNDLMRLISCACAVLLIRRQTHDPPAGHQEGRLRHNILVRRSLPPTLPTLDGDELDDAAVAQSVACGLIGIAHEPGLCSFRTFMLQFYQRVKAVSKARSGLNRSSTVCTVCCLH